MKLKYGLLAGLMAMSMDSCHAVRNTMAAPPLAALPAFLPAAENVFVWRLPAVGLAEAKPLPSCHIDITEHFNSYEINNVRATDPKLFAHSNQLSIDLDALQRQPHAFPLPGAKVISPFGGRRKNHAGADLKTFARDTIRAAFDGIVRMAKPYAGYGNVIVLRHYNGLETVYGHNYRNLVKQGERVHAGQAIALVGRTGRATTEHLHFETRIDGCPFNPALLFNLQTYTLRKGLLLCRKQNKHIEISSVQRFPLGKRPI
ncbi:MAG: M23 family metallopeptidase [Tannerella sp.]|jgi:murein DD-endopeptidase MepM/ murein hydrolase activator NlpD|nr:M23 family metallopeptidase [Tannerella sp.]